MSRILSIPMLAGFLASAVAATAATIADGSSVAPPGTPRSTFVNDSEESGFGKDPFFPKTTRFTRKAPKNDEEVVVVPDFPTELIPRGISLVGGKKLAIINYQTVAEHEEFSVKANGKVIKGQCVEIKEKSVVLKVNGVTKELSLGSSLK